jgi:ribosomal protein S8
MLKSVESVKCLSVLLPRSLLSSFKLCKRTVCVAYELKFIWRFAHGFFFIFFCIGYIGEFEIVDDHRAGKIVIELKGRINKCGVISPRFDVKYHEYEKWINNLLPARQFGHIVLSTTFGIMDHHEARRKHTGGKVIGFFY